MRVRAVRGATQLEEDSHDHMLELVAEMVTVHGPPACVTVTI